MLSFVFPHRFTQLYGQCLLSTRSFLPPLAHQKLAPLSFIATIHTTRSSNNSDISSYDTIRRGTRSVNQLHSRQKWSEEEDQRLATLYNTHGPKYTYLAKQFINRSPSSIYSRCKLTNLHGDTVKVGPWKKEELEALRQLTMNTPEAMINWEKVKKQLPFPRDIKLIQQTWYHSINPKWNRGSWTADEINGLMKLVRRYGEQDWCKVSDMLGSRSPRQCLEKYRYQVKPVHKGHFTPLEDRAILAAVEKHGDRDFMLIKKEIKSQRTPRQISHHYRMALDPAYDRSPWSTEEKAEFWELTQTMGSDMVGIRKQMNSKRHVKHMWNQYMAMKRAIGMEEGQQPTSDSATPPQQH